MRKLIVSWQTQYPISSVLFAFVVGICLATSSWFPQVSVVACLLACVGLLATAITLYRMGSYSSIVYILLFCIVGYIFTSLHTQQFRQSPLRSIAGRVVQVEAVVLEPPVEKKNSFKVVSEVRYIRDSAEVFQTADKVILYLQKSEVEREMKYGDVFVCQTIFNEVEPPYNPHQFDYKRYLKNKNIGFTGYVRSEDVEVLPNRGRSAYVNFRRWCYDIRDRLLQNLKASGVSDHTFSLVAAMLLGFREGIDPELRTSFSHTGISHLLCVSGMHVGLVCGILTCLFSVVLPTRRRASLIIKNVLLVGSVWLFVCLTGATPSAVRSGLMMCLVMISYQWSHNNKPVYQGLIVSALLMLCCNPLLIYDIGFQLSYAAVFGILWLVPKFEALWSPQNRVLFWLWQGVAVSVSAQVLTLPLSVYYFHVVPLGFVFANLIVMLLIMPIMYVGLVVLLLGKWLPVLGCILGWLINVLITSVQFIEHIPHVTLSNISVYVWQVVLMYVLLWLLVKYSRRVMGLAFSMVTVAVLMVSFLLASTSSKEQCEMVLFNINQHTALQVVEGKQAYLVADAGLLADSTTLQYNLEEYNIAKHIKRTTTYELGSSTPYKYGSLYANANVVQYNKTRFLFVGHADVYDKAATLPLQVDYVVLTNNTRADVAALAKCVTAKQWVLDRSNSNYYLQKFESVCDSLHLPYYSMRTRKALVVQP